jgi:hypothetical protein
MIKKEKEHKILDLHLLVLLNILFSILNTLILNLFDYICNLLNFLNYKCIEKTYIYYFFINNKNT